MKKIIITACTILYFFNGFSQCASTTGNYEFSISNDAKTITIYARNTTSKVRSNYIDPAINGNFIGLVFGIKWSAESDIQLYENSSMAPFHIVSSNTVKAKDHFLFQSYGDNGDNKPMISNEWMSGEWNIIATIPYTGNLAKGDQFELTECGFDETTDPYFSRMDDQGNYVGFAPNLVANNSAHTSITISNGVIVYPNPTKGNLYIDVSSSVITRAKFTIMNMEGKILKVIQSDLVEGINKIILNVDELSAGLYILKVTDGKALNYSQKFTKE